MEKYTGIRPESEAKNTPDPQYSHTETHLGRNVKYFHTWRKEDSVPPLFSENAEPNRAKINGVEAMIRGVFWLGVFAAVYYLVF